MSNDETNSGAAVTAPSGSNASQPLDPIAEKAIFALWLWLTTNSTFFALTEQPDGTTQIGDYAAGADPGTFSASLESIAAQNGAATAQSLVDFAIGKIQTDRSLVHNVINPSDGTVIQAQIPFGAALLAVKELYAQIAAESTTLGAQAYAAGTTASHIDVLHSIVPPRLTMSALSRSAAPPTHGFYSAGDPTC